MLAVLFILWLDLIFTESFHVEMGAPLLLDIRLEIHARISSKLNSLMEWKMAG